MDHNQSAQYYVEMVLHVHEIIMLAHVHWKWYNMLTSFIVMCVQRKLFCKPTEW